MPTLPLCPNRVGKSRLLAIAAALQALAVTLGALGAHGHLRSILDANDRVSNWETAVLYHLVHGTALLALAIWMRVDVSAARSPSVRSVAWLWSLGILFFSGSIYVLALGGPRWLGPVTPLGGLCFIIGWAALASAAWRGIASPPDAR
jgi:uncharacterized membrane protein YgdD (TMEM256/DUF423 family)